GGCVRARKNVGAEPKALVICRTNSCGVRTFMPAWKSAYASGASRRVFWARYAIAARKCRSMDRLVVSQVIYHTDMTSDTPVLQGNLVRLEPLGRHHIDGLVAASAGDPQLYKWSPVPQSLEATTAYVETALKWRDEGRAAPFAIVRASDGIVIGSSRFFDLERWAWPPTHPLHGRTTPDVCEIGYTWLARTAIRSGANTEAKLL